MDIGHGQKRVCRGMGPGMFRIFLALLTLALIGLAAAAEAQLIGQRTEGIRRICVYQKAGTIPTARRGRRNIERVVGYGEPCPQRDPGPARAQEPAIPSMAQYAGERRVQGVRLCDYQYLGRRYSRAVPAPRPCPLTPHFF